MNDQKLRDFGKIVKSFRSSRGYSQEELAEKAKVHRTYVGMIERGEKNLTIKSLDKIAKALGVKPSDILRQAEKNESSR